MTQPSQQGTSSTGGVLGGTPAAPTGPASVPTALNNQRQNATFPTLSPPPMNTLVYAPDVNAYVVHDGLQYDLSRDIVRGWCSRKENSASSLMLTLANQGLRYNANLGSPVLGRMDRIILYLTRTTRIQVFSGYLDTVPYFQAYPGTVDIRATCTLKRLLHTWWNPALPNSQVMFNQLGAALGTAGDGQGGAVADSGIGSILRTVLQQVGQWTPQSIHVQNFPQEFITFLNNYMVESNLQASNANLNQQFEQLILGPDTSPGPMGSVGYSAGDPVGTSASAVSNGPQFYLGQIVAAVDQRGMGPIVDNTANSQQVNQSANVLQSAPQTANQYDAALAADVASAGQQLAQYTSNWSTQNKASDGAILAVACVMVESTPAMLLEANNAVPESMSYWHDGLQVNGTGCGLYNQPNNGAWGTVAQRMNPLASSGMFLDALNAKTGWRNMDPGQAIWLVQQSDSSKIPLYDAAITAATTMVQAYRKVSQGAGNTLSNALGAVPGASTLLGGGANPISGVANILAGAATTSPISTAAGALQAGRPVPDSEGAINAATTLIGTPYVFGGVNPSSGVDCSRMVELAFLAGTGIDVTRSTDSQRTAIPSVPIASIQRGDVLQTNYGGHTGIYLGAGQWIQTGGPGAMPGPQPVPVGGGGVMWAGRVCANGGTDPAAPFSPITGVIGTASAGSVPGTGTAPGQGTGGAAGSDDEPIARNIFSYIFEPGAYASTLSQLFTGEKAYIDCQPLMQMIVALCSASMRNFQSAPNGDFMAYYPDPFGLDGKPAILALEDIELKDCHIDLSDDPLTTHVYIEGDYTMMGQADQTSGWLLTSGVATVQNQFLYKRLTSTAPGDVENLSAQQLMNKFGVRPYKNSYEIAGNAGLEFLLACQIFMGKWAAQFTTDIGLTFMPELYPGMRVILVGHNLSVYVSQVTHEFDWQRGFTTTATVSAAGKPNAASAIYSSLPGFLNPVSTNPTGAGNTSNTGQPVTAPFAAPIPGGLLANNDPRISNGTF